MTLRRLPLLAIALLLLAGCGSSGSGSHAKPKASASPAPTGFTEIEFNALRIETPRAQIETRYGPPFDPKGVVPQKIIDGIPKSVSSCEYFHIIGGKPVDFAQLCFARGKLQTKLSLITPKPSP